VGYLGASGLTRRISIHAPKGGATVISKTVVMEMVFQSTLPRGERHDSKEMATLISDFNPRSQGGSDDKTKIDWCDST